MLLVRFPLRKTVNVSRILDRRPRSGLGRGSGGGSRVGHAPTSRFLFPALPTHLQPLGPLSVTGTAQRTGPHRPVTAGPAATQAREGSRNRQAHRPRGGPM